MITQAPWRARAVKLTFLGLLNSIKNPYGHRFLKTLIQGFETTWKSPLVLNCLWMNENRCWPAHERMKSASMQKTPMSKALMNGMIMNDTERKGPIQGEIESPWRPPTPGPWTEIPPPLKRRPIPQSIRTLVDPSSMNWISSEATYENAFWNLDRFALNNFKHF